LALRIRVVLMTHLEPQCPLGNAPGAGRIQFSAPEFRAYMCCRSATERFCRLRFCEHLRGAGQRDRVNRHGHKRPTDNSLIPQRTERKDMTTDRSGGIRATGGAAHTARRDLDSSAAQTLAATARELRHLAANPKFRAEILNRNVRSSGMFSSSIQLTIPKSAAEKIAGKRCWNGKDPVFTNARVCTLGPKDAKVGICLSRERFDDDLHQVYLEPKDFRLLGSNAPEQLDRLRKLVTDASTALQTKSSNPEKKQGWLGAADSGGHPDRYFGEHGAPGMSLEWWNNR
jgi:hypothetical protein